MIRFKLVHDRKNKSTNKIPQSIYIEAYLNRKRRYFSTGISVCKNEWDKNRQLIIARFDAKELNYTLQNELIEMYKYVNSFNENDLSLDLLDAFFLRKKRKGGYLNFWDFIKKRINERVLTINTVRNHTLTLKRFKEFGEIKEFSELTRENILKWNMFLENYGYSQTTIHGHHKRIKVYINEALYLGLIDRNPYEGIKINRGKSAKIKYLTKDELERLEKVEIEDGCIRRVRDLFVFCTYTGLSYSDLALFDFSNCFRDGEDYFILDARRKTGVNYFIMLLPKPYAILKKYDFKLPLISNAKYNLYLKIVGKYASIDKSITTHMARHTFATTVTLSHKVPIEILAKMLGHSDIKTTQVYAKVVNEDVKKEFRRLKEELK